jgi:hypothetical protein
MPFAASAVGMPTSAVPRIAAAFEETAPKTASSTCRRRVHLNTGLSSEVRVSPLVFLATSGKLDDEEFPDRADK